MQNNGILNSIKANYSPAHLAHALRQNQTKHIAEYKKAVEVYDRDLVEAWEEFQKLVKRAAKTHDAQAVHNGYYKLASITKPVDLTEKYNHYIAIFQSVQNADIELTIDQANAIINDEWDWALSAKTINATYSSRSYA